MVGLLLVGFNFLISFINLILKTLELLLEFIRFSAFYSTIFSSWNLRESLSNVNQIQSVFSYCNLARREQLS